MYAELLHIDPNTLEFTRGGGHAICVEAKKEYAEDLLNDLKYRADLAKRRWGGWNGSRN